MGEELAPVYVALAPMLPVTDVERAHQVLSSRGMSVGDIEHPFYNPRGEFHVHDPDGHAIFIAHADYARGQGVSLEHVEPFVCERRVP